MPEVNNANHISLSESTLQKYGTRPDSVEKSNELGKSAFLNLMIAQLKNQDPLSPAENSEFIAQLAQFSSVEGIENLNTSMASMSDAFGSSQALQASALVGRSVQVPGSSGAWSGDGALSGTVELASSTNQLSMVITNGSGEQVKRVAMNQTAAGSVPFAWDGRLDDGSVAPAGVYSFKAEAMVDGTAVEQEVYMNANVDSVTIGAGNNVTLNVNGVGPIALSDVKMIK